MNLVSDRFIRQSDLVPMEKLKPLTVTVVVSEPSDVR